METQRGDDQSTGGFAACNRTAAGDLSVGASHSANSRHSTIESVRPVVLVGYRSAKRAVTILQPIGDREIDALRPQDRGDLVSRENVRTRSVAAQERVGIEARQ